MIKHSIRYIPLLLFIATFFGCSTPPSSRTVEVLQQDWDFRLEPDTVWRSVDLPHDWSIEGEFSENHPAGVGGGALPGGTGWYQRSLKVNPSMTKYFLQFDGVYQNSTVWVNGDSVGTRPNGYISFEYDITPYIKREGANELLVKVANTPQPNSRWYSGSGIYREVRLVQTNDVYIPKSGIYVKPDVENQAGIVNIEIDLNNDSKLAAELRVINEVIGPNGQKLNESTQELSMATGSTQTVTSQINVENPELWSIDQPNLYTLRTNVLQDGNLIDVMETRFGFRTFHFDVDRGFFLNGKSVKIKGVCLHHDLGALGAAFNKRAAQRQLEIMQGMGVNSIRTSHNPPAPELLDLCDEMGILVMDEMFDMWSISKVDYDYSLYWEEWHAKDLTDFILRDRNHPSIIVWSIGNEIMEQYNHEDSTGGRIARELSAIVRQLDDSRPIVTANNDISPDNSLIKNGGLDLLGYNYHHDSFEQVPEDHPGIPFIATETNSSLATRGYYDMPSDSIRIWPERWDKPFDGGNPGNTVSAYDNARTPWGSTQEDTWRIVKNNEFISGMYIWTGFDYLGEPTPYTWPSRSSYFGIVDLAGFPKDTYYMYKSEWTEDTVLHVFPHWNWTPGQAIDIWAYYNHADEVELFLNGESKGIKSKGEQDYHLMWRLTYEPGEIRVVSRKNGEEVATKTIQTAGEPAKIKLIADRQQIDADGKDLSFITVKVLDDQGVLVPNASSRVAFEVVGEGKLVGVDNGNPVSHESFTASKREAFHGLALAIIQSNQQSGKITIKASSDGLVGDELIIESN